MHPYFYFFFRHSNFSLNFLLLRVFLSTFDLHRKSEQLPAKRAVRPFSSYAYDIKLKNALTERENFGFAADNENKIDNKTLVNGGHVVQTMWYRDVVELRKKAEEYKVRTGRINSL